MKNDLQLIIAGFGGQGILFTGKLLTHSAMLEGRNVTGFPSYGAEIRGGIVNCTVIISDEMIGSPIVRSPNSLMVMNRASKERFESQLKPHGLFIMNTSLIKDPVNRTDIDIIRINATDIAEELGNVNAANMVMLGALVGKTGIIKPETVSNAMKEIIPKHRKNIIPLNETAFKKGIKEIAG